MNVKRLALMALKALDFMTGRRYWDKSPGEVVAMRRSKKKGDKRWSYVNRRFPCSSHRRN